MGSRPEPSVEDLLDVEARLDRSFAACVLGYVAWQTWFIYLGFTEQTGRSWAWPIQMLLFAIFLFAYVWFAVAVTAAAGRLGKRKLPYFVWMVAAPILSLVPIPIVSQVVAASPLSLKFLLAGELRREIHDRMLAD